MLQISDKLSKVAKYTALFTALNGIFTLGSSLIWLVFFNSHFSFLIIGFLFALIYFVSGYFGLQAKRWAFALMFVAYLIQVAQYFSPTFNFSFQGGVALNVLFGTFISSTQFSINIVAIALCALSWVAFDDLKNKGS